MISTTSSQSTILIVEDEQATRTMLSKYLADAGYKIVEAASGDDFRREMTRHPVDLVLLDIRLPDADGVALARDLRAGSNVGIIFVTSLSDEIDRVLGLEVGADDYVTKPVALRELLARVRSTLRRLEDNRATPRDGVFMLGVWEIDTIRREAVGADGKLADLTRAEFDLVSALVQAQGRPVSRDYLLDVISRRSEDITDRTVDTLVSRLRQKLEPEPGRPSLILTERGIGYRVGQART
ncbi:MAG: response regulator transcription factor [Pseudomonadota bacterium]